MIVLTVLGTVDDRTIHDLEDVAWPRLAAFSGTTVIDLSHAWLIDVPGLQMLTQAYMRTQARGGELRAVVESGEVLEALRAAGLAVLSDIHPSVQDALAADRGRAAV